MPVSRLAIYRCALVIGCFFNFIPSALAQKLSETHSARDGIYSLVEINPADLMWGRYRLANENLIFESLSVAWTGEFQELRKKGDFLERNFATGIGLQYYPQSVTLQGPFFRGEADLAFTSVSDESKGRINSKDAHLALIKMAGDMGWRVRLSDRLTGSAAYGLRTTLPQYLWSDNESVGRRWIENGESLDFRVQINLGILL